MTMLATILRPMASAVIAKGILWAPSTSIWTRSSSITTTVFSPRSVPYFLMAADERTTSRSGHATRG
jgi:hypothetical protein